MQHVRLGNSGLKVSRLCLGCMTYGDPAWRPWVLDEERARPFIREALEAGIDFFDSADIYSTGESERILGRALRDFAQREDLVIATKAFFPMSDRPNACGLSRKHLLASVDASLRRLGTDYLDLFVIHRFDPDTPIEETCETLDSLVRVGKVRYLGASSMPAWRFMKMLAFQRHHGLAQFISMQSQYNLIVREDEEDLVPLCREEGIALTPWSRAARSSRAWASGRRSRSLATMISFACSMSFSYSSFSLSLSWRQVAQLANSGIRQSAIHFGMAVVSLSWMRRHEAGIQWRGEAPPRFPRMQSSRPVADGTGRS